MKGTKPSSKAKGLIPRLDALVQAFRLRLTKQSYPLSKSFKESRICTGITENRVNRIYPSVHLETLRKIVHILL